MKNRLFTIMMSKKGTGKKKESQSESEDDDDVYLMGFEGYCGLQKLFQQN